MCHLNVSKSQVLHSLIKNGPDAKFPFKLTDADGTVVYLPRGEVDQYVGKKVKITGQGTYSDKGGKSLKTITKIEKV